MEAGKYLDSQLWNAYAGGMVQMPSVNFKVFYFPQRHVEHAQAHIDLTALPRIPALIPCRVGAMKFLADPDTDEVFAKIRLVSMRNSELGFDDDCVLESDGSENPEKPASFTKKLTQSDANNGCGSEVLHQDNLSATGLHGGSTSSDSDFQGCSRCGPKI